MDFSGCLNDESIGPAVQGCRGDFDFTIKFEKIFFDLLPTAIFLATCLPRIVYLARRPAIVGGVFLRYAKLVRNRTPTARQALIREALDCDLRIYGSSALSAHPEQRQIAEVRGLLYLLFRREIRICSLHDYGLLS